MDYWLSVWFFAHFKVLGVTLPLLPESFCAEKWGSVWWWQLLSLSVVWITRTEVAAYNPCLWILLKDVQSRCSWLQRWAIKIVVIPDGERFQQLCLILPGAGKVVQGKTYRNCCSCCCCAQWGPLKDPEKSRHQSFSPCISYGFWSPHMSIP